LVAKSSFLDQFFSKDKVRPRVLVYKKKKIPICEKQSKEYMDRISCIYEHYLNNSDPSEIYDFCEAENNKYTQ